MNATIDIDHVAELLHLVDPDEPLAIGIEPHTGSLTLAVRALGAAEPSGSLLGFVAPAPWTAFAVVGPGHLTAVDAEREVPDGPVVHLASRDGRTATRIGPAAVAAAEPQGWVPDLCHRVLGLPTPAPTTTTASLLAAVWLDRILADVLTRDLGDAAPDWAACRALLTPADDLSLERMGAFGISFAERWPWPIVRRYAIDEPLFGLSSMAAGWLDDGSFSRYVLGGFAPLAELRADVVELLSPPTARCLEVVLDQWLDPRHG